MWTVKVIGAEALIRWFYPDRGIALLLLLIAAIQNLAISL